MLSTEDEFAALLRRHIQEQELGVNELARRAGISNATISRLLTQRRTPRMATASKIAHALGFDTVEGMLRGEPRRTPPAEGGTAARPTAEVRPTVQQSSGYALAVPVVGRGHAGPGGGSDEPYVFVPLDTAQGRQVLSLQVSGDCLHPEVLDQDIVVYDAKAEPQDGDIIVAGRIGQDDVLVKRYYREGNEAVLQSNGDPIIRVPLNELRLEGVVFAIHRNVRRESRHRSAPE